MLLLKCSKCSKNTSDISKECLQVDSRQEYKEVVQFTNEFAKNNSGVCGIMVFCLNRVFNSSNVLW